MEASSAARELITSKTKIQLRRSRVGDVTSRSLRSRARESKQNVLAGIPPNSLEVSAVEVSSLQLGCLCGDRDGVDPGEHSTCVIMRVESNRPKWRYVVPWRFGSRAAPQ